MDDGSTAHRSQLGGLRRSLATYEVFLLAALLWFLGKYVRYAFPPLFDELQGSYGVSTTAIGGAYSAFLVLYALMQFPSGALADRFGSVRVITLGGLIAGAGALIVVASPPFALLVVAMAIIGAGTGAHKTVAIRLLSNVYPDHLGRALGVFDTIGTMGGVVAPLVVAAILGFGLLGWPGFFAVTAVAFLLAAVAFYRRTASDPSVGDDASGTGRVLPWRSYRSTFARPPVLAFIVLTVLVAFAYNGLVAFLPLLLAVEGGVSPAVASALYSVLFVASVVQLVSGEAADRIGPLRIVTVGIATATTGVVALLALLTMGGELASPVGIAAIAVLVLAIGIGAHGYRPARDVYLVHLAPEATTGGVLGVVRTLLMSSAAIAPIAVGLLGDTVGLMTGFVVLAVMAALAGAIAVGLLLTQGR